MEQEKKRRSPISDPLIDGIRGRIRRGDFKSGEIMPSLRKLAQEYAVSLSTMTGVMDALCREGVLVSRSRRGFFVTDLLKEDRRIALLYYNFGIASPKLQMMRAIQKELTRQGKSFYSHDVMISPADPEHIARNCCGVIAACYDDIDQNYCLRKMLKYKIPAVIAGLENTPDISGSYIDHKGRIFDIMRMLYDMGHRRIGMTVYAKDRYFYPDAIAGYRGFLNSIRMPFDPALIQSLDGQGTLGGYLSAKRFFSLSSPPTAIILGRDSHGIGVFTYCEEKGIVFGKDISVIGFDDCSWHGSRSFLSSTTEPADALGHAAAAVLCDMLNGVDSPRRREIPWHYRMRKSVIPLGINPVVTL